MQAKELFKLLVREQLGPLLWSERFVAPGQSWRLEHPSGNAAAGMAPPDTWRLLHLSVLLAAQGRAAAWIGSLSSCRTEPRRIGVRPGWLSTSRTCASAP